MKFCFNLLEALSSLEYCWGKESRRICLIFHRDTPFRKKEVPTDKSTTRQANLGIKSDADTDSECKACWLINPWISDL